jgi:hypothetical protein
LEDYDKGYDGTFYATLTGMVMRSLEHCDGFSNTYHACWLHIKYICENLDLPSPRIQSSASPDPRIRLLDDLGLTGDLPLDQRPWIADLYMCNTDLLYSALPRMTEWPNELSDEDVDKEWQELELLDEMSDEPEEDLEECNICRDKFTAWELKLKDKTLKNGQWVGPHCIGCNFGLFQNGSSSRFTPEWYARGHSMS